MAKAPGPYDLGRTRLVVTPGADVVPRNVGPGFYEELNIDFAGFAGHVLLSRHEFIEPWGSWEMHPNGDEIICLESGDIEFVLWVDGAEKVVKVDRPGSCIVVPKGVWHTARPKTHTVMLFFTPGEGTRNASAPPENE